MGNARSSAPRFRDGLGPIDRRVPRLSLWKDMRATRMRSDGMLRQIMPASAGQVVGLDQVFQQLLEGKDRVTSIRI